MGYAGFTDVVVVVAILGKGLVAVVGKGFSLEPRVGGSYRA